MTSAEHSENRYEALELDLISCLDVDQLLNLEIECVEIAKVLRLERFKTYTLTGVGLLVGFALLYILPARLVGSALGLMASVVVFKEDELKYALRFTLGNGKTFAVHEWMCMIENPFELRYWNEVKSGVHGKVEAVPVRLTKSDRQARHMAEQGIVGHLMKTYGVPIVFVVIGGFVISGVIVEFKWILLIGGFAAMVPYWLHRLSAGIPGAAVSAERIDPNESCEGNAYRTVVQVLDSKGVPHGARRIR